MKQKIVLKVDMPCQKCRTKALKIASKFDVDSIMLDGKDKDQLVVIGDGVDTVKLTSRLKKNVGHAMIMSVGEVKEEKQKGKDENPAVEQILNYYQDPYYLYSVVVEDPKPSQCCQM